jgi:diguanylate cyclase (GGDEF)-like protein
VSSESDQKDGIGGNILPSGHRPYYCLISLSDTRSPSLKARQGIDYCAGESGTTLVKARDSGDVTFLPYRLGRVDDLAIGSAIYRGGGIPSTESARVDDVIGFTGTVIIPSTLLNTALSGHPDMAAELRDGSGSSDVVYKWGDAIRGGQTSTVALPNGWDVETIGPAVNANVLANRDALYVLIYGVLLSLLLGRLIYVLGTGRSKARKLAAVRTEQLQYQAVHDRMTGLPNRALIVDRIEQMLTRTRGGVTKVAVLIVDLDDFKDVNDTLGHQVGDRLLIAVSARLRHLVRSVDTVGRLSGDEFVIVVEVDTSSIGADLTASRVLRSFDDPFELGGSDISLSVTASIGIAESSEDLPEDLMRDADVALYRAKSSGKNCAVRFSPSMQVVMNDRRRTSRDLYAAVDNQEFFLVYQPTFDLSTEEPKGVEALIRWQHPKRGVMSPDQFMPALESSGLIFSVGSWVLSEACSRGEKWKEHGISVSVNISASQLARDRIVDDVKSALDSSGLKPSSLILELTETALLQDVEKTVERLNLLKSLGVRLAIDDFGTGYSSLAYLQQFPFDVLKIDRSFVANMDSTSKSLAIVHTFVELGKALGLEIVAEGIEDEQQRRLLVEENVDTGQGFLFSRPLSVEDTTHLIERPVTYALPR